VGGSVPSDRNRLAKFRLNKFGYVMDGILLPLQRPSNRALKLSRSHVAGFVNSVQSSCRQFMERRVQFTKPPDNRDRYSVAFAGRFDGYAG
jgi:hypothetical protein